MKKSKAIFWGAVLIIAGLGWGLSELGLVEFNIFFKGWWTLFIIIPCAVSLFTSPDKLSAGIGVAIGVILLLCVRDVIEYDMIMKLVVPAIIVIIGVKLIANAFGEKKTKTIEESLRRNADDLEHVFALFTGEEVKCDGKVFRGAELNAIFGGIDYDLRGAVIEPDCAIKATAIFGGIEIIVPDNVKVRVKSTGIFGGTSNKARRPDDKAEGVITLYVSSLALFGGVDIK
jgi:predicted membrane protein